MNRDEGSGGFASRIQRSVVRHVLVSGGAPTAFAAGERGVGELWNYECEFGEYRSV